MIKIKYVFTETLPGFFHVASPILLICCVAVAVILLAKISLDAGCLTSSAISFEGEAEYLVGRKHQSPTSYHQFFKFLSRTPRQIFRY
jgi:hypothetical protein